MEALLKCPKLTKTTDSDRQDIVKAMRRDVEFLKHRNLMDYSLLVGIEKKKNKKYSTRGSLIAEVDERLEDSVNSTGSFKSQDISDEES